MFERAQSRSAGLSADEYLVQSILDPKAFIVDGFDDSMPGFSHLSQDDVADLVTYLKTIGAAEDVPPPALSDIPAELAAGLPALDSPDALEDVAQWIARSIIDDSVLIAPDVETKWLDELLSQSIFPLTLDERDDSSRQRDSALAKAMVLSTLSIANERFFAFYTSESAIEDMTTPRDPWVAVNHNGAYSSALRFPPAITAVLGDGGATLATLINLDPTGPAVVETVGDVATVTTTWEGERDGETVLYSRSVSVNGSTLTVVDEVETVLEVSGLRVPIWPVSGSTPTDLQLSGDTAIFTFESAAGDSYVINVSAVTDSPVFTGGLADLEVSGSSRRVELQISFDEDVSAGLPLSVLDPAELVAEHSIGSVLLRRNPALESRISRLSRSGFEIAFEAAPYVVLAHPDFLDPDAATSVTPVVRGSENIPALGLEVAFPGIAEGLFGSRPLWLSPVPDGSGRTVVIDQDGKILVIPADGQESGLDTFLDLTDKVDREGGERGLLGLAFHPDYIENGLLYIAYSNPSPRSSIISEFKRSADGNSADLLSERVLIDLPKDNLVHNGGAIAFGPDGYLYISLGDDEFGSRAQDTSNLYGSILRIDVDSVSDGLAYGIPPDNPFVSDPEKRDEIWAYGLRNPWRFSFDREDGSLWAGDVGNRNWEEIDFVVRGANYGWLTMEGSNCFRPETDCDTTGLTLPVYEYSHNLGCAVVGGYVYRGSDLPELQGAYIFGDYCTGRIWGLRYDQETGKVTESAELAQVAMRIASFAEDANGEIYVVGFSAAGVGNIFRLTLE